MYMFRITVCGGLTLFSTWNADHALIFYLVRSDHNESAEPESKSLALGVDHKAVWRSARKLLARRRHWFSIAAAVGGVMCFQKWLNIILSRQQTDCWDLGSSRFKVELHLVLNWTLNPLSHYLTINMTWKMIFEFF